MAQAGRATGGGSWPFGYRETDAHRAVEAEAFARLLRASARATAFAHRDRLEPARRADRQWQPLDPPRPRGCSSGHDSRPALVSRRDHGPGRLAGILTPRDDLAALHPGNPARGTKRTARRYLVRRPAALRSMRGVAGARPGPAPAAMSAPRDLASPAAAGSQILADARRTAHGGRPVPPRHAGASRGPRRCRRTTPKPPQYRTTSRGPGPAGRAATATARARSRSPSTWRPSRSRPGSTRPATDQPDHTYNGDAYLGRRCPPRRVRPAPHAPGGDPRRAIVRPPAAGPPSTSSAWSLSGGFDSRSVTADYHSVADLDREPWAAQVRSTQALGPRRRFTTTAPRARAVPPTPPRHATARPARPAHPCTSRPSRSPRRGCAPDVDLARLEALVHL